MHDTYIIKKLADVY